jgi:hypothetical protein
MPSRIIARVYSKDGQHAWIIIEHRFGADIAYMRMQPDGLRYWRDQWSISKEQLWGQSHAP